MLLQNGSYIFIYYIGRPFFLKVFLNEFPKVFSKCLYLNPLIRMIYNNNLWEKRYLFWTVTRVVNIELHSVCKVVRTAIMSIPKQSKTGINLKPFGNIYYCIESS